VSDRLPWRMRRLAASWSQEDVRLAALLDMIDVLDGQLLGQEYPDGMFGLKLRLLIDGTPLVVFAADWSQAGCVVRLLYALEPLWRGRLDAIAAGAG
jgi:hypothetical protein